METIELDDFSKRVQRLLEKPPLIVLGSGASAPFGLPTMSALANAIAADELMLSAEDTAKLLDDLKAGVNLEQAINESGIGESSLSRIREIIWREISSSDRECITRLMHGDSTPLELVLEKTLAAAGRKARIVTTNYDRLAEIAIDKVGATCIDGFFGHILRQPDLQFSLPRAQNARRKEPTVELWKVHGSLDWFSNESGSIFSLPFCPSIPDGCIPLIVPPNKEKYATTSQDPYRNIITHADEAFCRSQSFLCVGYGFGDSHIHPHLIREAESGKPIVILARTLTQNCTSLIQEAKLKRFIALEMHPDAEGKTHMITRSSDGDKLEEWMVEGNYWDLAKLVEIW